MGLVVVVVVLQQAPVTISLVGKKRGNHFARSDDTNPLVYSVARIIFDKEGVAALEEKRVIRLNDGSILHHDWMGKDVFVIECEELRYERDTNTIVPRLSVTFNRGVHRAIMHRVAVKRAALEAHHRAHPRPMQPKPRVTPTDLGWILVSCDDVDAHGKPVFTIEYPDFDASEDTATWAGKALR